VSGVNPFTELAGYSGEYQLSADSLSFTTSSGAATPLSVPYGLLGQDELIVKSGTVLAITANPAAAGGILFNEVTVQLLPIALTGDYNNDGTVDAEDYDVWVTSFGSSYAAADGNGDGVVDAADYVVWRKSLTSYSPESTDDGHTDTAVPEPSSWLLWILVGLADVIIRRSRPDAAY
jgi:hypothetical protein